MNHISFCSEVFDDHGAELVLDLSFEFGGCLLGGLHGRNLSRVLIASSVMGRGLSV